VAPDGFKGINIPDDLHLRIQTIVNQSKGRYSSITHYIKYAIEKQLTEDEKIN
jgi:Arc/MetJ-type ribon-helix-helix transcriptional regulator